MAASDLLRDPALLLLAVMSLASWAMIFERLDAVQRADAALERLRLELERHADAGREHLATILDTQVRRERRRLEGPLPLLGVIGSTAPYVGLLGTVIGIIQAFAAIQRSDSMSPAVVSGGISHALVATAAGLAVAIPAVAAHHLLTAAIGRRAEAWEEALALEMPDGNGKDRSHEFVTRGAR